MLYVIDMIVESIIFSSYFLYKQLFFLSFLNNSSSFLPTIEKFQSKRNLNKFRYVMFNYCKLIISLTFRKDTKENFKKWHEFIKIYIKQNKFLKLLLNEIQYLSIVKKKLKFTSIYIYFRPFWKPNITKPPELNGS